MARRTRKKSKTRPTAYTRNRERIMRYIRAQRKRGIEIDLYFPTEREVRKSGVRGQELASLTRILKTLTPKVLKEEYGKSITDQRPEQPSTNEQGFSAPFNPATFHDIVTSILWNDFIEVVKIAHKDTRAMLQAWVNSMIAENGKDAFMEAIRGAADNGKVLTYQMTYAKNIDMLYDFIEVVLDNFPDQGVLYKDETLDRVKFWQSLGDALEQDEDWQEPL